MVPQIDAKLASQSGLDEISRRQRQAITLVYQANLLLKRGFLPNREQLEWLAEDDKLVSWAEVYLEQHRLEIESLKRAGVTGRDRWLQAEDSILGPARTDLARFWPLLSELDDGRLAGQLRMQSLQAMHAIDGPTRLLVSAIQAHDGIDSAKKAWRLHLSPVRL